MASDGILGNYRRGVMSLVLLGLLRDGDMYGYQIVQEIEKRSEGVIVTQEGSLYPVLYKLLDAGYVSDQKVLVGKRMTRVYYHLEPSGEQHYQELLQEYQRTYTGVLKIVKGE